MEHFRFRGRGVGGRHPADAVDRGPVGNQGGSLQERPASELLPLPARFEHESAEPGAEILYRVRMGATDVPAVDVQRIVVGDRTEAGDGVDQIRRAPRDARVVLCGGRAGQEQDRREGEAGEDRRRGGTSHDVSRCTSRRPSPTLGPGERRHACSV